MSKPFDATLKELAQACPLDYLAEFDTAPQLPVSVLNVDLSTVTTAADLVLGLGQPLREAIHLEFHASASEDLHRNTLAYNSLLYRRLCVPVHSIIILLRPKARHPNVHGRVQYSARPGRGTMDLQFELVELWERPVEHFLAGPLGVLPFAPLGRLPPGQALEDGLGVVIGRLVERLDREAAPAQAAQLVTASYLLTGLRLDRDHALELFWRASAMRESDTYLAILDEGAIAQNKRVLLRQGRKRFGEPDASMRATLEAIPDLQRLEQLSERLLEVSSWQELLHNP